MDKLLEIIKPIAICKSNNGNFCHVLSKNGNIIEFHLEPGENDTGEIYISKIKTEIIEGRINRRYWRIDMDNHDLHRNIWYLDESIIFDYSLFDL